MSEYIDKDKLLKYLEDTIIFSGKAVSPYLNGQVNGARLVISRIKDYKEDKQDGYKEGDSGQSDKRNLGCIRIGPTASHAVQRAENYAAGKI